MASSENRVILAATFAAGDAPTDWQPAAGASLAAQCLGAGGEVQATNYREAATGGAEIVALGTVAGDGAPLLLETVLAYVRFVPSGAGSVRISAAIGRAGAGGGAGGGASDTTEATQLLVKTAVQGIDSKTPALVQKQVVDEASATVTYIGEAALGTATSAAAWRIKRVTISGAVTTIEWSAAGVIFDNRASLGYT